MMFRILRGGGTRGLVMDLLLLGGLISLVFIFLKRHGLFSESGHEVVVFNQQGLGAGADPHLGQGENAIEARIKQMGDFRSDKCRSENYSIKESVSIIIDFNDYQFYNLKTTIGSILHAGTEVVAEIIVVDDGSTLQYIMEECDQFLVTIPNVKLIRHRVQQGQLRSRLAGLAEAKSDIVVFLDVKVVVSRGWLEPLIDLLTKKPNTIAMPHYDTIQDPVTMEYRSTTLNLVAIWTWNLAIQMRWSTDPRITPDTKYIMSPAVHGSAFAVRKVFLEKAGSLDAGMEDGGGEYLDLSLKTWFCGGEVMVVACSRVGILNLFSPIKVKSRYNKINIIQTYLGGYIEAALNLNAINSKSTNLPSRSTPLTLDLTTCRNIDWYLKEVKNETRSPSSDALYFGALRIYSGRCARFDAPDGKLDLNPCPELDPKEPPVELTITGRLRVSDGRCLTTTPTAYILAEPCQANDTRQEWRYTDRFELVNTWSGFCARHVTDPDKSKVEGRQVAMAQDCKGAPANTNAFKQWFFISS